MESNKTKSIVEVKLAKDGKGITIRLGAECAEIVKAVRNEVNKDPTYKKKVSNLRVVEKLIESRTDSAIAELKMEREGAKEWNVNEYRKESPDVSYDDWIKRMILENRQRKKTKKATDKGAK